MSDWQLAIANLGVVWHSDRCENLDCEKPFTKTHNSQRFCSNKCMEQTHLVSYIRKHKTK